MSFEKTGCLWILALTAGVAKATPTYDPRDASVEQRAMEFERTEYGSHMSQAEIERYVRDNEAREKSRQEKQNDEFRRSAEKILNCVRDSIEEKRAGKEGVKSAVEYLQAAESVWKNRSQKSLSDMKFLEDSCRQQLASLSPKTNISREQQLQALYGIEGVSPQLNGLMRKLIRPMVACIKIGVTAEIAIVVGPAVRGTVGYCEAENGRAWLALGGGVGKIKAVPIFGLPTASAGIDGIAVAETRSDARDHSALNVERKSVHIGAGVVASTSKIPTVFNKSSTSGVGFGAGLASGDEVLGDLRIGDGLLKANGERMKLLLR